MNLPLIITAFGTSSKAFATYDQLDKKLHQYFDNNEIHWAYSSRQITNKYKQADRREVVHTEELLNQLSSQGVERAIVQSLHLFPGKEFHSLCQLTNQSRLSCSVGMPLLTSPQDYMELAEILTPTVNSNSSSAVLILGHGTDHPIWVAYYCLERILNDVLNKKIYVGVVEKYPDSSHLIEEIEAAGIKHLFVIPLFLVAGMHYRRDIVGQHTDSWQSRLQKKGITVDILEQGLGLFPGIEKLICRHIQDALNKDSNSPQRT